MSIADKFADTAFEYAKLSTDDEYQEDMYFKYCTVAYFTLPITLYFVAAVLAWAIPGPRSFLALLVVMPLIVAEIIGQSWLKERAPRPRAHINSRFSATTIFLGIAMLAGLAYNSFMDGDTVSAIEMILGGIIGGIIAAIAAPKALAKVRHEDEQRLEEDLED